jgi:putative ABC transport system substrate-binding protein
LIFQALHPIPDIFPKQPRLVARILQGEKPAELAVIQLSKIIFVINLKTAKTLGLIIPSSFPSRLAVAAPWCGMAAAGKFKD